MKEPCRLLKSSRTVGTTMIFHQSVWLSCIAFFLWHCTLAPIHAAAEPNSPLRSDCTELPFHSFPPNQLLRQEQPSGSALSLLMAKGAGTWGEYFIQVDQPGTYRLAVSGLKGPDQGICQAIVNDEPIGSPIDFSAETEEKVADLAVGQVTFLKSGNYPFRFQVTGKSLASRGYQVGLQSILLTPTAGFTLLSPNGSDQSGGPVLLRWHSWPAANQYRVEVDGAVIGTVDAPMTSYVLPQTAPGSHRWRVVALENDGSLTVSNTSSFAVGNPPPYLYRDYVDDFSGHLENWTRESMSKIPGHLQSIGSGSALLNDVALEKWEGEVSATLNPASADAVAGIGFQAMDGTRLYAVLDLKRGQFRIERRVKGYSIFEVTPKKYQMKQWLERADGESMVMEISAEAVAPHPGLDYQMKLAFSRRSSCVLATLIPSDGSPALTLRALSDQTTPDHPLLLSLGGENHFSNFSFKHVNKLVYKWDPDSYRIVLRPGAPGTWDSKGAFNPAVLIRNGTWYLVYRGNAVPAPPNGSAASELGLATSTDGLHWTKYSGNPIIAREESKVGSVEDPDLLWPEDSQNVNLEYVLTVPKDKVSGRAKKEVEVMRSSPDWIHWSEPWILNSDKTWGKIGGLIDTHQELGVEGIRFQGVSYRYTAMIEEGRIDLSPDLNTWVKAGTAPLVGRSDQWCNSHECAGDIFVDADHNIRYESQAGVKVPGRGPVVGNPLCTLVEGVLSGADPTKVLWRSDLPWLPDWYGDAPTGSPEDFTASNGSVFPGQTVSQGGWLWHFSGGNNTFTVVSKCWYGPLLQCRGLQTKRQTNGQCAVIVTVRNIGSLRGEGQLALSLDGITISRPKVTLERDTETTLQLTLAVPPGVHTVSVDDLSMTVSQ